MTNVYIFDFGRVIIDFDPTNMTAAYIKDEKDVALAEPIIFDRLYWDRLDEGTISDEETKQRFCERLPQRLHDAARKVYDNWYTNLPKVEGVYEIIEELKREGKRLYLLSNISLGFAQNYKRVPYLKKVLSLFDGLVFSGEVNMIKPHRDIFEYLLNKYSLTPRECTFIDDSPVNIAAAKELGINTYLFDGDAKKLREYIFGK